MSYPPNQPPGGYPPPPGGYPPPNYPPPQQGGYPPQQGGYGPPPQQGGYPPQQGGYGPPPQQGGYGPPPQQGGYGPPPQQGGYGPPPQQGGYGPPPQQGGYPAQPTGYPPQQGGYPQPGYPGQGGAPAFDVGAAFNWAWNKFSKNAGALIVSSLIYAVVVGVLGAIFYAILIFAIIGSAVPTDGTTTFTQDGGSRYYSSADSGFALAWGFGSIAFGMVAGLVMMVLIGAITSAYFAGILDIADGKPVEVGSFLKPRNLGSVILASLIIGVLSAIGSIVIIGSIVVAFFTFFTTLFIVERGLKPIDGLKASFELVKANVVPTLLTYLVVAAIMFVGYIACGIGIIVAAPVAALVLVYSYRQLTGGQIAPAIP